MARPEPWGDDLQRVFAYVFSRVGNRSDAEDITQDVAMKAFPRLRASAERPEVRSYLFATARSRLAEFWAAKFALPTTALPPRLEVVADEPGKAMEASPEACERVEFLLAALPPNYRRVLELRFLRGYSLKEVATEMGTTVGNVKVMQLRALRAAARVSDG